MAGDVKRGKVIVGGSHTSAAMPAVDALDDAARSAEQTPENEPSCPEPTGPQPPDTSINWPTLTKQGRREPNAEVPPTEPEGAADSNLTAEFHLGNNDAATLNFERGKVTGAAQPPPSSDRVVVPGYEILEELGRGGMGVVYKARHVRLQRLVALKMILAGVHAGAADLARFRGEAEAVAQLQHPNIVQIYETGEHEGRPYFSLEFVEGGSLEARMQQSAVTPRAAAELLETLARTVEVAHQHGIVHRDLKPANILLGVARSQSSLVRKASEVAAQSNGNWQQTTIPKIADFGLAKRVDDDSSQTQSGAIIGTPCYMAPEQAEGKVRELGPGADIYALGAMLYELLTGKPPFKAARPIDTIRQVIEQEPVPPRQLDARVPLDLETICLKCLEKDPARRYGTAGLLAADLRRFLEDEPILARPTPAWERACKWGKRRPTTVALLGVCALAAMVLVLFIVWHNLSLRGQLDEARAEERQARQREEQAVEGQRLARVQGESQKLLDEARLAVATRDWPSARLQLTKALATIGSEPRLQDLNAPAQALLQQVEEELRGEADRQASQVRFQQFGKLRDEAQFLGTLYTGMDLAANLQATRAAVRKALAVYGVSPDNTAAPTFDAYLNPQQKGEILQECYQLLLILAETEAQGAAGLPAAEQEKPLREAVRVLQQALQLGRPSRAWQLRQARYWRLLGDQAAAQQADQAAAAASMDNVLDHFLVADEFYRRGTFDEAIKEFDQVLQRKPGHFWSQYLSALCLLRQHRPAEAKAQLSACLAQRSDFVWLYLLRGFAQTELLAFDAADADFQKALQMPLDDSSRYVLFVDRGLLRIRQQRFDDALADLKTATELKPDAYQAYVNLAHAYRGLQQLDQALAQMDEAVRREPTQAHLYRLRARLQLERKEPAAALKDLDQAIQREDPASPLLPDDNVERGRLLLRDRKYAEALSSLDAALRLRPGLLPAQRLRAEALFFLGRYQDAVEAFDRYLETGKPLESVYRGRGLARAELGKYPGAIDDFTRALELQPTSAVQAYRGWAHLVCEAPKLALRDFELAIELDPKNGDAYNGRGTVLVGQGRLEEASRDAEQALRFGPKSSRLLYNAARIQAQCGGKNELRALDLIRQALELLPAEQRASFWSKNVRKDSALDALHGYPQFLQLEAAMSGRK